MPTCFDLQAHSTHSDGTLTASEVVASAARAGVSLLALTDHDTVDGVAEALRAGAEHGVRVVPAIEISAIDAVSDADLHILGYGIDHTSGELERRLEEFRADRAQRTLRMAAALRELGFELPGQTLDARVRAGQPIGRPHLATAVLACPANRQRLHAEGITELGAFIEAHLIESRPAYVPRTVPSVEQAVNVIHDAGGVAVWAHPFRSYSDPAEVLATIDRLSALGVDGVEAFYISHTRTQTELLAGRCAELGLLSTGSADFHGPENPRSHRFLAFETYGLEPNLGPIAA
ncbi:MAG TPA: PHP domain-containing protein [Solirubrobacteraceae bacterium]|nr:PHP domain-containing protein [Solirubrobacteraceae bacterium]